MEREKEERLRGKEEIERNLLREKEKTWRTQTTAWIGSDTFGAEYAQQTPAQPQVVQDRAKAPKLPSFVDGKDDREAYLQCFERFATTAKWDRMGWATKLSALLSGCALDVY